MLPTAVLQLYLELEITVGRLFILVHSSIARTAFNLVQVHVALRSRLSYVFRRRSSYIPFQIRERDSYFSTTLQVSTFSIQDILSKTGIDRAQEISKTHRRIFIGYCLSLGRHESWNVYNSHQIQCFIPVFWVSLEALIMNDFFTNLVSIVMSCR